jgi:hypothetical protein
MPALVNRVDRQSIIDEILKDQSARSGTVQEAELLRGIAASYAPGAVLATQPILPKFEDPGVDPKRVWRAMFADSGESQGLRLKSSSCSADKLRWYVAAASVRSYRTISAFLHTEDKFEQLRARVISFRDLPENWDTHGAAPISEQAILHALMFVTQLERNNVFPDIVLPTSDESIFFRIELPSELQEWEFFSNGEIGKLAIDSAGNHTYFDVTPSQIFEQFQA